MFARGVYIHTCHMRMRRPVLGRVNLYLALEKAGEDGGGIMPMTLRASSLSVREGWVETVVKMMHGVGGGWSGPHARGLNVFQTYDRMLVTRPP